MSRARASDAAVAATPDAAPAATPALALERGGPDAPLAEKLRHRPLTVDGARTTIADVDVTRPRARTTAAATAAVRPTGALTVADLRTETRRRHDALVSP